MAGVKMSTEILKLRKAAESFGFVVRIRNTKIHFLNPNGEEVYIATKLPRPGYYSLNKVDREMWEVMGSEGIVIYQTIITTELLKYLYEYMVSCKKSGMDVYTKRAERPTVKISRRIGRDHQKEYAQRLTNKEKEEKKRKIKRRKTED